MKQYRVAIIGKWESYLSYFLMGAIQGVFENGGIARPISIEKNSPNEIWDQINFFKPHLVLIHTVFDNQPHREQLFKILEKVKNRGAMVGYHCGDARPTPRYAADISSFMSFALVNHWPLIDSYKVWNIPCYHWPYMALSQEELAQPLSMYKSELAFAGSLANNIHHAPRARFISQLTSVSNPLVRIKTFPTPESGNTRFQTPELSISAQGVLGLQMGLDMPGYQDVRPFQFIGAGALYFHDKHPNMDMFFKDGKHYVSFKRDDAKDFYEKWKRYAQNQEESMKIRLAGFKYCQRYHSSKERMRQIFNILEDKEYSIKYETA